MKEETFNFKYGSPIKRTTLDNGLRIISHKFPDNCIHLYIATRFGSNNEKETDLGAAHFIEHMLFRGTSNISGRKIIQTIDSLGAHGNANTEQDRTLYYLNVQDKYADKAINLIYEMAFKSSFFNLEIERKVILKEIIESNDNVENYLCQRFHKELYKKHPMKNDILGTEKTISEIKKETLLKYYHNFYIPNNMVLAVVGEINEEIMKKIKEKFEKPEKKVKPDLEKILEPEQERREVTEMRRRLDGAHIMLGTQLRKGNKIIKITDSDAYPMFLISELLTGSFSSRLYIELREKRGMVYGVDSGFEALDDYSEFTIDFTTSKSNHKKTLDMVLSEVERLKKEYIGGKEFKRLKEGLEADYFIGNGEGASRAESFIIHELLEEGVEEFISYPAKVNSVTPRDILRVANEYINTKNPVIVKILPKK